MLDAIFERAPVGLAVYDRDLRYVRINDHLAEINGIPAAEHIGRAVAEIVPDVEAVEPALRHVLEAGEPLTEIEVDGHHRRGARRRPRVLDLLLARAPPRRPADPRRRRVVFEVTERRAAERALREQTARYESLLRALSEVGEAMLVAESDGRIEYANPAFLAICGYSTEELQALPSIFDLVVEEQRKDARKRARLRLAGFSGPGNQLTLRHRDGHRVPLEIAGVPLEVDGRSQMVIVGRDVTARARAEAEREWLLERAAFLAEASATFDAVLDEEPTLDALARLSVRDLADTCVILLGGSAAHHPPRRIGRARPRRRGAAARARRALSRSPTAARTRCSRCWPPAAPRLVEHPDGPDLPAQDERHRELIAAFTTQCTVLVPLRARGRTLGVMALGFDAVVGADHLSLFEDLARRAALAIDNARLYEERAQVARTLQRSLLPPVLPDVPGHRARRALRRGRRGQRGRRRLLRLLPHRRRRLGGGDRRRLRQGRRGRGGDRARPLHGARVGDAALRQPARRAPGPQRGDPPRGRESRFCTVLYVSLSPRADGVTACVATGGHPLPLILRADGSVETVGLPGTLLGILPDPEIRPTQVFLRPGDSLILYTDGVIEVEPARRPLRARRPGGLRRGAGGRAARSIARHIEDAVLEVGGGTVRDDVAVVVLRVIPAFPRRLSRTSRG